MASVTDAALIPAPRAPSDHRYDASPFRVRSAKARYAGDIPVLGAPTFDYPPASAVAEDMLYWLERQNNSVVLDPVARTWLRYDCATGRYSPLPGTAEQAARVLIREAAAACQRHGAQGWRTAVSTLTGEGPLSGLGGIPLGGHQAAIGEIAAAMVDIASGGERAAATRRGLADGRYPGILFTPLTWRRDDDGYGWWSGQGSTDIDWSPECPDADYAVPLKAARYNPEDGMTLDFDGNATVHPTPLFDQLCKLVWPDPAVRNAALRALSMGFTGRATKYVIYWSSETGRGKSLMASLVSDLLGGYAKAIPAKTLFGYTADPQRAAEELAGTWLAIVEEGIGDQSFKADAAFKLVTTGGGDLNAPQLYRESRQVEATHTVLLAVNPEAGMNYADPAIRARLCPIRFDGDPAAIASFAEAYNPASAVWKAEAPAVLAKMLDYARDFWTGAWKPWTMADIDTHAELAEVIDDDLALAIEMKTGSNVAAFIAASRRQLAGAAEGHGARDLYRLYAQWAAVANQDTVTETAFGRALGKCAEVTRTREAKGTVYRVAPPAGQ